ncbi:TetR/AcrR family transcriptional regulator [Thiomonas sp. 13-64-67]|jgi:AcrR family transcriptional regulator|uniref:TetR/AcrR family transcriptional regulator n=1 Tax=Thiomonas sp. 13-64-67 TaxID=1970447 RepID=UPI000BCACF89|nr:TetR/AcrR family transcriptional regulator [Thiomonas sp. 13-64-67]OZB70258.1 MAG: hypothetical protein B7X30_09515 [Thiomonas sp. 13-64-67]
MAQKKRAIPLSEPKGNRYRIIEAALEMFNTHGERNITTNHVCEQTGISPGNLYYHFRSKQEIIYEIYLRLEEDLLSTLNIPPERQLSVNDIFIYVNGLFQTVWKYRFFFRDLAWMVENVPGLQARYIKFSERVVEKGNAIYSDLVKMGVMSASYSEIQFLTVNSWALLTYWLTYARIHISDANDEAIIVFGIRHFVALFYAYLLPDSKIYIDQLMGSQWVYEKAKD